MYIKNQHKQVALVSIVSIAMILSLMMALFSSVHAASKINLKISSKVIDIKGNAKITVKGVKSKSISKKFKFKSSNRKIAKVNYKGEVKGVKRGTVKITVISKKNKNIRKVIKVKVKNLKPTKITVSRKTVNLKVGQTYKKLSVKVSPKGVYCPISFKSVNTKIASVNSKGVLKAKSQGTTNIIIKSKEKNKKGKYLSTKVKVIVKSKSAIPQKQKILADGVWYGTGTDGYHYELHGPDIVKVTVKDKKISEIQIIKSTEDNGYERGQNIIKYAIGLNDVSGLEKQLKEKKGEAYDAVARATRTADGHLSAVKNAVERSEKFAKDKKTQNIDYFDFVKRPKTAQSTGKLDLSETIIDIHFKDGTVKQAKFDELAKYGIEPTPKNGSSLPKLGTSFLVHFRNNESLVDMPARVQVQKAYTPCIPTHALVSLKNGKTIKVKISDNKFRFEVDVEDDVENVALFYNDIKLTDGKKTDLYENPWEFNLKNVPLPRDKGYTGWGFETYYLTTRYSKLNVESFELDLTDVKKDYIVGTAFDVSNIKIKAKNFKGETLEYKGLAACEAAGFVVIPNNKYIFTAKDVGTKKIEVRYMKGNNVRQFFDVTVKENVEQIPAKIELYDKEKKVCDVSINKADFEKADGYLKINNVELPKQYENKWDEKTFKVKMTNAAGVELDNSVQKFGGTLAMKINVSKYKTSFGESGYVLLVFSYK